MVPAWAWNLKLDVCDRHHDPRRWEPSPVLTKECRFAFSRRDTLDFVFSGSLPQLKELGWDVVELDVIPYHEGPQDQVVFIETRTFPLDTAPTVP